MTEAISSSFFRELNTGMHGEARMERIFPTVDGISELIEGQRASEILRCPDKVTVTLKRDRLGPVVSGPENSGSFSNHHMEVRAGGEASFEIGGWELQCDSQALVAQIEGRLGVSGLTIVLARGVVERDISRQA